MLIRESYLEKVRPFVGLDVVKVITGMRRSGKSVLMEQIRDEIILKDDPRAIVFYMNLEEEHAKFLKKGVLHEQVLSASPHVPNLGRVSAVKRGVIYR